MLDRDGHCEPAISVWVCRGRTCLSGERHYSATEQLTASQAGSRWQNGLCADSSALPTPGIILAALKGGEVGGLLLMTMTALWCMVHGSSVQAHHRPLHPTDRLWNHMADFTLLLATT
jgi:hypothetical protein